MLVRDAVKTLRYRWNGTRFLVDLLDVPLKPDTVVLNYSCIEGEPGPEYTVTLRIGQKLALRNSTVSSFTRSPRALLGQNGVIDWAEGLGPTVVALSPGEAWLLLDNSLGAPCSLSVTVKVIP